MAPPASGAAVAPRPYGMADSGLMKGGKRSGVAPRAGNKQMTF